MSADYTDCGAIRCSCGRAFAQLNAYTNHQWTCRKRKKHLSSALAKAKSIWDNRKKRRTGDSAGEHGGTSRVVGHQPLENGLEFSYDDGDDDEPLSVCALFDLT